MGRTKIYKTDKQKSKAQIEWNKKWAKKATISIAIRLHNEYDKDVIEHLKKQDNKTNYLRQLIIQDMNNCSKK